MLQSEDTLLSYWRLEYSCGSLRPHSPRSVDSEIEHGKRSEDKAYSCLRHWNIVCIVKYAIWLGWHILTTQWYSACIASIVRLGMTTVLQSSQDITYNVSRVGLWAYVHSIFSCFWEMLTLTLQNHRNQCGADLLLSDSISSFPAASPPRFHEVLLFISDLNRFQQNQGPQSSKKQTTSQQLGHGLLEPRILPRNSASNLFKRFSKA